MDNESHHILHKPFTWLVLTSMFSACMTDLAYKLWVFRIMWKALLSLNIMQKLQKFIALLIIISWLLHFWPKSSPFTAGTYRVFAATVGLSKTETKWIDLTQSQGWLPPVGLLIGSLSTCIFETWVTTGKENLHSRAVVFPRFLY